MNTHRHPHCRREAVVLIAAFFSVAGLPSFAFAQAKKNPASKVYISDVSGEAQIDTGENIQDLSKRSVYTVQGSVIETKKTEKEEDKSKAFSTMVFSNGTGAYFDQDTRVEMKKFVQEPFTPNRADMDVEPSISQTQAFVARGTVGLCTSKLVAGSSMNYQTSLGNVNIRGKKVVIQSTDEATKISMLEGESTVRAGSSELGGRTLKAGEQAIIRRTSPNAPPQIQIGKIPPQEMSQLDDRVAQACMAKKTVYFEVKERSFADGPATSGATPTETAASATATESGSTAATASAPVTAFDGNSGTISTSTSSNITREIVAVPVVPVELPVQNVVSPAAIITPRKGG